MEVREKAEKSVSRERNNVFLIALFVDFACEKRLRWKFGWGHRDECK